MTFVIPRMAIASACLNCWSHGFLSNRFATAKQWEANSFDVKPLNLPFWLRMVSQNSLLESSFLFFFGLLKETDSGSVSVTLSRNRLQSLLQSLCSVFCVNLPITEKVSFDWNESCRSRISVEGVVFLADSVSISVVSFASKCNKLLLNCLLLFILTRLCFRSLCLSTAGKERTQTVGRTSLILCFDLAMQ